MRRPPMCSCRCANTQEGITWNRMLSLVGEVDDESLPSHDRGWRYSGSAPARLWAETTYADWLAWTQVYNDAPAYEIRMKPVRYRIGSNRDFDLTLPSNIGGNHFQERVFFSFLNAAFITGGDSTPAESQHYGTLGSSITVIPPFHEIAATTQGSRVTHCRVLIDGVDATGVVPVTRIISGRLRDNNPITLTVPGGIPHGSTVEIDFWYLLSLARYETERTVMFPGSVGIDPDPFVLFAPYGSIAPGTLGFGSGLASGSAPLRTASKGNFEFSITGGTVAGTTAHDTRSAGWIRDAGAWKFSVSGSYDQIEFRYRTEQPFILVRKPVASFFYPDSPVYVFAKYEQVGSRFQPCSLAGAFTFGVTPPEVAVGGFNASEPNEFRIIGFHGGSGVIGHATAAEILANANFAQFPPSITVEKV
jgi:hypothetical protein